MGLQVSIRPSGDQDKGGCRWIGAGIFPTTIDIGVAISVELLVRTNRKYAHFSRQAGRTGVGVIGGQIIDVGKVLKLYQPDRGGGARIAYSLMYGARRA